MHDVVFFEEPVHGEGAPHLKFERTPSQVLIATPQLPAGLSPLAEAEAQKRLLDGLLADWKASRGLTLWYGTPMMLAFSRHLPADLIVYDNMDELSAFLFAPPSLLALEEELLGRAHIVFTGGNSIYEAKKHRHPFIHAMPSSIDKAHFYKARRRTVPEPADQRPINGTKIGWFGVIDERMNPALLDELARLRPDWQFIMIGPVVKIDPQILPKRQNIHWLGPRRYQDLPAYLAYWDGGFIPYALNEATRFISPTKTPEFLAAGVPLVSTPIADIVRPYGEQGLVRIVNDAPAMAEALKDAMCADREGFLAKVDGFLADKSWDKTWEKMTALMAQARQRASERELTQGEVA